MAISHILKNSVTHYGKLNSSREGIALLMDRGLSWSDGSAFPNSASHILISAGDSHKRQRRALAPAFGLVEAKALLPYFARSITKVSSCLASIQRCDRQVLYAAGGEMARVDRRLHHRRVFGGRYTFMDE